MGIKRNFLFSSVLTVSGYVFPIIVYPHVARALGVYNMGVCNFVDSLIDYFVLFSMLGIATIGVREIAACRGDRIETSRRFLSIFAIGGISTLIALAALVACTLTIDALSDYKPLMFIGILKLLGNFLLLDWLFQGLEDFRYITIRTISIKIGYAVAVFIWVWNPDDYLTYYFIWCVSFALNAVFSCSRALHLIDFKVRNLEWRRILKPILILGLYMLLTSMYTTFNIAYLGFECGDVQVGYYTTATKFFLVLIGFYAAFTRVMIPRMSSLVADGKKEMFQALEHKAVNALIAIAVPLIIFTCVFSEEIIRLFSGDEFLAATLPARIVFPLIFIIGYEQIIILQVLLPMKKDRALFVGSIIGAVIGIAANLILVPRLLSVGSAIAWVIAETAVMISGQVFVSHYLREKFPFRKLLINVLAYVPLALLLLAMWFWMPFIPFVKLLAGGMFTLVYATGIQIICLRDELAMTMIRKVLPFVS